MNIYYRLKFDIFSFAVELHKRF